MKIFAHEFDTYGCLDSGGKHVHPRLNGHSPGIGQSWELDGFIHFLHQLLHGHALPPFGLWFEGDGGLEHGKRCRIGGGLSPAYLTEHVLHFRKSGDNSVGLLQELFGLGNGDTRQRCGHVEQVAFVERRHELRANVFPRNIGNSENNHCQQYHQSLGFENQLDNRVVDPDEETVDRVFGFRPDLAPNPVAHEHRYQGYSQK